jgi:repressor of nif and glnA expression
LSQPSIQTLIVEILQEKKKPLSVNEIADSLLKEKKYKTKSANFKNQLRVLLYRNQKAMFKKVGTGQFGLAGPGKAPAAGKVAVKKKPVVKKKVVAKKKAAPKKKAVK